METQLIVSKSMSPDGNVVTVSHPTGATKSKDWPKVYVALCDQNHPQFTGEIPSPFPMTEEPYVIDHEDDIPVTNSAWTHTFSGVPSGQYTILAVKKVGAQKQVEERDNVSNVQVP